jgi:hypothetical protein
MPMRILPPARPSRVRWFPAMLLTAAVGGSLLLDGLELESSEISSRFVKSFICKKADCFFSAVDAIEVMARRRGNCGRLDLPGWVRAHYGGCRDGGAGACSRGRRPAEIAMPPHILAEGRLFPLPPGHDAIWEAVLLLVGSHGVPLWRPRRTKWLVPRRRRGESGVEAVDPIAFSNPVQGPSCKNAGTSLYFLVFIGSSVIGAVIFVKE